MNSKELMSIDGVNEETAKVLAALIDGKVNPEDVSRACKAWTLSCYNEPSWQEKVMCAANDLIGGHGVEGIDDPESCVNCAAAYVNLGDTYITTLMYDYRNDQFIVSSWGDYAERNLSF